MRERALRSPLRRRGQRGGGVGQPRHHHTHHLLTRWTQRLAAPARAWSVFPQIFAAPWEAFHHAHPRSQTPYYDALVRQLLACGHPLKRGSVEYRCLHGGPGQPLVAMSGTSSRCLRCAKVSTEHGVRQVRTVLHEGGISRPIILTGPAMCRSTFDHNAAGVLRAFMRGGAQCVADFDSPGKGKPLQGG